MATMLKLPKKKLREHMRGLAQSRWEGLSEKERSKANRTNAHLALYKRRAREREYPPCPYYQGGKKPGVHQFRPRRPLLPSGEVDTLTAKKEWRCLCGLVRKKKNEPK